MDDSPAEMPAAKRVTCMLMALLVTAAAIFCYWRTIGRVGNRVEDFAVYWASSRAMLEGHSLYDQQQVVDTWMRHGGESYMAGFGELRAIASPTAILLVVPLAMLPLPAAVACWWVAGAAVLLACAWLAGRLAGLRGCGQWGAMLALALAWGPSTLCLSAGQPALVCAFFLLASLLLSERGSAVAAGMALGLALAVKPQLGCIGLPWLIVQRQWRSVWVAVGVAGLVAIAAASAVGRADANWYQHWIANLRETFAPDAINDFGFGNRTRDHFLNLQGMMLGLAGGSRLGAQLLAWGVAAGLALLWATRVRLPADRLAGAMAVWVVLLLPVYHRYYDAIVLLPVAAWCIASLARGERSLAVALVALAVAGLITPVGWPMNVINKGLLPETWAQSPAWRLVIQPYSAWLMLMMAVGLLLRMAAASQKEQSF